MITYSKSNVKVMKVKMELLVNISMHLAKMLVMMDYLLIL